MPDPILSVVIPTYNRAHLVIRAIQSVLSESTTQFEVVVVDDGSTDATQEVLLAIRDHRLRIVRQANCGVSVARNAGVAASRAPFVAFLDSDDEALNGWLDFYLSAAQKGVSFATCGAVFRVESGSLREVPLERLGAAFGDLKALFLAGGFGVSREVFDRLGGFRPGLDFSENTDFGLRLGGLQIENPFDQLSADVSLFMVHSRPRGENWKLRYESAVDLIDNCSEHLRRDRRLYATYLGIAGVAAGHLGWTRDQRSYLLRALRADFRWPKSYLRLGRSLLPGALLMVGRRSRSSR